MIELGVGEGVDDIAEAGERLIDLLGLVQHSSLRMGLADLLAASEVDHCEFG
jgi:hypothetical protein